MIWWWSWITKKLNPELLQFSLVLYRNHLNVYLFWYYKLFIKWWSLFAVATIKQDRSATSKVKLFSISDWLFQELTGFESDGWEVAQLGLRFYVTSNILYGRLRWLSSIKPQDLEPIQRQVQGLSCPQAKDFWDPASLEATNRINRRNVVALFEKRSIQSEQLTSQWKMSLSVWYIHTDKDIHPSPWDGGIRREPSPT